MFREAHMLNRRELGNENSIKHSGLAILGIRHFGWYILGIVRFGRFNYFLNWTREN